MARLAWLGRQELFKCRCPLRWCRTVGRHDSAVKHFLDTVLDWCFCHWELIAAILQEKCVLVRSLHYSAEAPVIFKGHVVELPLIPDFFKRQTGIFRQCFFSILFEKENKNVIEINPQQIMATQNSLYSQSWFVFYNLVLLNLSYRTLLYVVSASFQTSAIIFEEDGLKRWSFPDSFINNFTKNWGFSQTGVHFCLLGNSVLHFSL